MSVMHEVLLAMLGVPGDVFALYEAQGRGVKRGSGVDDTDVSAELRVAALHDERSDEKRTEMPREVKMVVRSQVGVSQEEKAVLERLCAAGACCKELERLAACVDASGREGCYRAATAAGVLEVKREYECAVLRLERDVLEDVVRQAGVISRRDDDTENGWEDDKRVPAESFDNVQRKESVRAAVLSACSLEAGIAETKAGMEAARALCWTVLRRKLRGVDLLRLVHAAVGSGDPAARRAATHIARRCAAASRAQLAAWLIYGQLRDPHAEFFVYRPNGNAAKNTNTQGGGGGGHLSPPPAALRHSVDKRARDDDGDGDGDATADWHGGFAVRAACLPPGVSLAAAEKLLFAGKAARVLRHPKRGETREEAEERRKAAEAALRRLEPCGAPAAELDAAAESLRSLASARLWELVVRRGRLVAHLELVKDFFLLARGDFWHGFLLEADRLLALPPHRGHADISLNTGFQVAGAKCGLDHADRATLFSRLALRIFGADTSGGDPAALTRAAVAAASEAATPMRTPITRKSTAPKTPGPAPPMTPATPSTPKDDVRLPALDAWDGLRLEYDVDWPLGLLLTPRVLSRYNVLFKFLLRLRRVQRRLDDVWSSLRLASKSRRSSEVQHLAGLWRLHQRMAHLVTNLQIYVQVDVIEAQFRKLVAQVGDAMDFASAERAHEHYLGALFGQTFLDIEAVSRLLEDIFKQTARFEAIVDDATADQRRMPVSSPASSPGSSAGKRDRRSPGAGTATPASIAAISEDFQETSAQLFTILRGNTMLGSARVPSLRQLLLRLNFNGVVVAEAARALIAVGDDVTAH